MSTGTLDVDWDLARDLYGVRMQRRAALAADRRDLLHGEYHARFVVRPHDRDQRAGGDGFAQLVQVEEAAGVHRQLDDFVPEGLEPTAGLQDGRVLHCGRNDPETRAGGLRSAADGGVVGLRRAGGEDHFVGVCVDEAGDLLPGAREITGDFPAKSVH